MRKLVQAHGVTVKAYAGTTGILLALNITDERRPGLLGFAIERVAGSSGKTEWLTGMLHFPGEAHEPGTPVLSRDAPIQKFRWSDYRVFPNTEYTYTVHPVYGRPGALDVQDGPSVTVKTSSNLEGDHCVTFNRAAAASQAFSKKFPDLDRQIRENLRRRKEQAARKEAQEPLLSPPPEALAWLTRGVLEQIVGFIQRADDETWALDIAIYEYELPEIVAAVNAAHHRGVNVRVVYHAQPGDEQTTENEENLEELPAGAKRARITSKICHHKFIVLSRMEGGSRVPQAVLCGSTNFTHNGVYRQANVVHVLQRPEVAVTYLNLFEVLFRGDDPGDTRDWIDQNNPLMIGNLFAGFSPRSGLVDLHTLINAVRSVKQDVLFCTAFDLFDDLEEALVGQPHDPILRFGVQNTQTGELKGVHEDRTNSFVAATFLSDGLEGWLEESLVGQAGRILIHTKMMILDFTSDHPTVISGSHNLSRNASEGNDENFLVIRGNTDVADAYGCELLRIYEHYRFRFRVREDGANATPPALRDTDAWTDDYFGKDPLKTCDRKLFVGVPIQ